MATPTYAAAATARADKSRRRNFLDLPAEIRNHIYDIAIARVLGLVPLERERNRDVLAQICRQIRIEYLARYYLIAKPAIVRVIRNTFMEDLGYTHDLGGESLPRWDLSYWLKHFGDSRLHLFKRFVIEAGDFEVHVDLRSEQAVVEVGSLSRSRDSSEPKKWKKIKAKAERLLESRLSRREDGSLYITKEVLADLVKQTFVHTAQDYK